MSAELPDPVDILAFGPHPDDVELCAGGLLLRAAKAGYRCAIVDATRGEAGTRGTPERRADEARAAAKVIGVVAREQLGLPDGRVSISLEHEAPFVEAIRRWRPRIVLGPCTQDRHPDHIAVAELLRRAYYGATIAKRHPGGPPPHRSDALVSYFGHLEPTPSFVVDVSDVWDEKLKAAKCYASQFGNGEDTEGVTTNISAPDFFRRFEARFAYWGTRIGADYGEPFWIDRVVPVDDVVKAFTKRGWAVL